MRSDAVVVIAPLTDQVPRISEMQEPLLVQTTIPELAIERFHERILGWFSRLNEMQLHPGTLTPEEHGLAGHLGAVVHHDAFRQTSLLTQLTQKTRHS